MSVICDFPRPPGGKLVCEVGQTGFVEILDGEITAICRTPPRGLSISFGGGYSTEFKEWVLAMAKHERFRRDNWLTDEEEAAFASGVVHFRDSRGRLVRVEFTVPAVGEQPEGGGQAVAM
ncbi:hypothetical protein [uncultured Brevundimonas sp.]|uniref:hypothetical protein n=1 Tax=uncultured Brevundimonas sp. TaxID=213418 RepID=UPI0025DF3842|nr:hypothetical protein [uncultured Brevundimonas sp.]